VGSKGGPHGMEDNIIKHFSSITMLAFWMLWQNILCIETSIFQFRNNLLKLGADIDISPSPFLWAFGGIDSFINGRLN